MIRLRLIQLLFLGCLASVSAFGQKEKVLPRILFKANEFQQYGFDDLACKEWMGDYDTVALDYLPDYRIPYKSVGYNYTDVVDAVFSGKRTVITDSLIFRVKNSKKVIRFTQKNDTTFTLFLPKMVSDYRVEAIYKGYVFGELNVAVYASGLEKVIVIPVVKEEIQPDSLERRLNKIYSQANLLLEVAVRPVFKTKDLDHRTIFNNPSPDNDRYTDQMRDLRDAYFRTYPNADKRSYYIFVITGFTDPSIDGYMVNNKAVGFVQFTEDSTFYTSIARQLGHGIGILKETWKNRGPGKGTTDNLMDNSGGTHLAHFQWEDLRHGSHSFSIYDNYEDVVTNSGLVAYYFWREDKDGNIILTENDLLQSIRRPYKKNYMSYHLYITDWFFQPLFTVFSYMVCPWHLLAWLGSFGGFYLIRRRVHRFFRDKVKKPRFWMFMTRIGFFLTACGVSMLSFILINRGYERFEVRSGYLNYLSAQSTDQAIRSLIRYKNIRHREQEDLASEVLIKRENRWYVKKRRKVLYFEVTQDSVNQRSVVRFEGDSDSLNLELHDHHSLAESHYMVFNYKDSDTSLKDQQVYNHVGMNVTSKLQLQDPAKRILIFVNGYRPTSVGHSFEDNFKDVRSNGLEFPNSENMIYLFDRYDYWRPWQEIDILFQKRINPTETYYADGHFSVTTSNHESLLNFTTVSSIYPKRCKNKFHHTCYTTAVTSSGMFGSKLTKTVDLHRTKPNRKGFKLRRKNGKIAGKNLYQLFNEIPNRSGNDTLFIVAHSMGYAYSLGILDELRGKIHFGGFYILAPENASAGKIDLREWQEVWQYGSNFNKGMNDAPCLLDGVAPQAKVGGLPEAHRSYIPPHLFKQKGFFDSHFVGYYTWLFDIPEGHPGYIRQR